MRVMPSIGADLPRVSAAAGDLGKKVSGGAPFSPLSLSPALWLKSGAGLFQERTGASATTPASADGDPVGTWQDQSGNARHLVAPTAGKSPTLKLAIQNGLPVVRFDAIDDTLLKAWTQAQPIHIFAVIQQRSWTSGGTFWDSGATLNNMRGYQLTSTPGIGLYANGASQGPASNGLAVGAFGLVEFLYSGTSSTVIVNAGTAQAETNPGTAAGGGLTLGSLFGGTSPGAVDCGELLLLPAAVVGANLTNLRGYLKTKWGTP